MTDAELIQMKNFIITHDAILSSLQSVVIYEAVAIGVIGIGVGLLWVKMNTWMSARRHK